MILTAEPSSAFSLLPQTSIQSVPYSLDVPFAVAFDVAGSLVHNHQQLASCPLVWWLLVESCIDGQWSGYVASCFVADNVLNRR